MSLDIKKGRKTCFVYLCFSTLHCSDNVCFLRALSLYHCRFEFLRSILEKYSLPIYFHVSYTSPALRRDNILIRVYIRTKQRALYSRRKTINRLRESTDQRDQLADSLCRFAQAKNDKMQNLYSSKIFLAGNWRHWTRVSYDVKSTLIIYIYIFLLNDICIKFIF